MLVFGRVLPIEELVERIDAVSVADVRRLAGAIFTGTTPTMAAVGPVSSLIDHQSVVERLGAPAAA